MNWLERARRELGEMALGRTANSAERTLMAAMAVPASGISEKSRFSIGSNGSALLASTPKIERQFVHCRDCEHHIPSPPIHRASGAVWEIPGGCSVGRTSADRRPPIYPSTGWYCTAWKARRVS